MGDGISIHISDGMCIGARASPQFQKMSQIYRVRQGQQLAGVCTGLEAAGKGSAVCWRLLFVVGGFLTFLPLLIYPALALSLPVVKTKKEAQAKAGIADTEESYALTGVEANLSRLVQMKEKGLITEDEFSQMRKKELGIN